MPIRWSPRRPQGAASAPCEENPPVDPTTAAPLLAPAGGIPVLLEASKVGSKVLNSASMSFWSANSLSANLYTSSIVLLFFLYTARISQNSWYLLFPRASTFRLNVIPCGSTSKASGGSVGGEGRMIRWSSGRNMLKPGSWKSSVPRRPPPPRSTRFSRTSCKGFQNVQ